MRLIDAHTHAFAPEQCDEREAIAGRDAVFAEMYADPGAKMATVRQVASQVEKAGFWGAVVAGFAFREPEQIARQNEGLREASGNERLSCLATVNATHAGWLQAAEEALDTWAAGLGELRPWNQGWDPLGRAGHELCELAAARGKLLLWHVSERVGHAYPGKAGGIVAEELWRLAADHPDTVMVAAHLGAELPYFTAMPEVRESLASTYFDTAASSLLYTQGSVSRLVDSVGEERVLFGSDYPLQQTGKQHALVAAELNERAAEAVLGGNAYRLFFEAKDL